MSSTALLAIAIALGVAGIVVLRLGWARATRSWSLNAAGWTLLAGSSLAAGIAEGAWGVSVAALCTMAAAAVALAAAAVMSAPSKGSASTRRVNMLPEPGEPRHVGRRVLTFLLTVAGGFAASLALSVALRALALALGRGEANANTLAFLAVPLVWGILATVLLMQKGRRAQIATLLCVSLPAWPVLLWGPA